MTTKPEQIPEAPGGLDETKLCVSCMAPNETEAHFCAECGAPMTSYASTGPFEHIFAEGHVYRQAAERPRRLVVVLGIWVIFGWTTLAAVWMLFSSREGDIPYFITGAFLLPVSLVMIWRTTRSYLTRARVDPERGT